MGDYTPTTGEVRGIYEVARALHPEATGGLASPGEVMAEFDRWLNAERARIWAEGYLANAVEILNNIALSPMAYNDALKRAAIEAERRNPYEGDD